MVKTQNDPSLDISATHDAADGANEASQNEASIPAHEGAETMFISDEEGLKEKDLRRSPASSRIANLRAAFETTAQEDESPTEGRRRFDQRPTTGRDGESEMARLKKRYLAEMDKIKQQQDAEIARLKEQHQVETANLKKQLDAEAEMRQAYEDKCTDLEEQVDLLQGRLASDVQAELHHELERRTSSIQQEKMKAQEEANNLQQQLYELKRGISTSTRIENETSDSTFTQQFQNLYHETQNWTVNSFRRAKVDKTAQEMCKLLQSIAEPKHLEHLRPIFEQFDPSIKLAAFQATVVCYMLEIFEEPLLFGIPSQQEWRRSIKKAAETLPAVLPPAAFSRWRATTFDMIRQSENEDIKTSIESAAKSMAEMICITLNTLAETDESASRVSSLQAILRRAISLSHLFRVQRSRYEFRLPAPGSAFEPDAMEDHSHAVGEASEGVAASNRIVRCSTFPSVVKLWDDNGRASESLQVVMKATVVCIG